MVVRRLDLRRGRRLAAHQRIGGVQMPELVPVLGVLRYCLPDWDHPVALNVNRLALVL